MIRHAPSIGLGIGLSLGSGGALEPYPLAGRVLDLGAFNYTLAEVPDLSPEDNDAVLYSGRGANLAGADYVELPDVGATKSITVLARSSTDTTIYATDDAGQTEDASATITADGTWQEVTITFTNAISGKVRLGTDGTSFFSGDLADARCKDASGVLLDQFYLNEHTDTAAAGLDGLPVIGRNGNTGQYVNCAAVVQEGFDSALAGLGAYGDKLWFNGVDTSLDYGSPLFPATADFDETFTISVGNGSAPSAFLYFLSQTDAGGAPNFGVAIAATTGYLTLLNGGNQVSESVTRFGELVKVRLHRVSGNIDFYVNDSLVGTEVSGAAITQAQNTSWGDNPQQAGNRHVTGLIYGDNVTGTPSGNFVTVAELRTTPPQVLGMDFNQYRWFNGVDTVVAITSIDFGTGNWRVGAEVIIEDTSSPNPILGDGANWVLQLSTASVLTCRTNLDSEIFNINLDSPYVAGTKVKFEIERSGNTLYAYVDGVQQAATLACDVADTFACDKIGNRGAVYFKGSILNANINSQAAYLGYGKTPWADTIGSNDGTESGTFENVLVSDYGTGTDALGNAITPRSNKTCNADGSGYGLVPDDDSLDLTTEATWVFKGNFYGTISSNETVLAKTNITNGTRSWQFLKDVTDQNDELSLILGSNTGTFGIAYRLRGLADAEATIAIVYDSSGATALDKLKVYVDGSPATVVVNNGTAPSSLFVSTSDITICARPNAGVYGNYQNTPISDIKIYNRALTAEEVAKFS